MKTIEEKARHYDEALERARKLKENPQMVFYKYSPKEGDTICDYIFPELAEPSDDQIKKAIYNALKYLERELSWDFLDEVDILDAYAWLEKQECFIDGKYSGRTSKEWTISDAATLKELIDFLENGTAKLQHDLTRYANWLKIQFTPVGKM